MMGTRVYRLQIADPLILQQYDAPGFNLVQKIHARTHLHPDTVEVLLERLGQWNADASRELKKVTESCHICRKCGEPQIMNKLSLAKIHREFNEVIQIDVMYWGNQMIFHAFDAATGFV